MRLKLKLILLLSLMVVVGASDPFSPEGPNRRIRAAEKALRESLYSSEPWRIPMQNPDDSDTAEVTDRLGWVAEQEYINYLVESDQNRMLRRDVDEVEEIVDSADTILKRALQVKSLKNQNNRMDQIIENFLHGSEDIAYGDVQNELIKRMMSTNDDIARSSMLMYGPEGWEPSEKKAKRRQAKHVPRYSYS